MNNQNRSSSDLNFTATQKKRVELMRRIAMSVTATTKDNFVLKGGTALLLGYGLDRYSTDLDFDGKNRLVDIEKCLYSGAKDSSVQIDSLKLSKDTDTVKRFMLHYKGSEFDPLKIEISFRQATHINEKDISVIDGIRIYKIEKLAELKTIAFVKRFKARDAFDIAFLLKMYPDSINDHLLAQIVQRVDELSLDMLSKAIAEEQFLHNFDPDTLVLDMYERLQNLSASRMQVGVEKPSIINRIKQYDKMKKEETTQKRRPNIKAQSHDRD